MAAKFKIDTRGVGELLKSGEVRAMVDEAADRVADEVRSTTDFEVEVDHYTTDRGAAAVFVPDVEAQGEQAKTGFLTRAAQVLGPGVDVRAK